MVRPFQEFFRGMKMDDTNEIVSEESKDEVVKDEGTRYKGKIFKLSPQGYGFISCHDIPFTRIFFHWSSLRANTKKFTDLKVGDVVEFTKSETKDKGIRAIRLVVLELNVTNNV